ncbi:glycosyltransferase family 2 protein [Phocaeicola salanitronis]|uniref:glycosyltransferase family 2 protein n=1 Tax=Phocaeicola salanitronis TaxID=376805 RepID=UPI0023F6FB52|nr:glycosyltransferase family 2 protein [Phocaeicola salanitronis]
MKLIAVLLTVHNRREKTLCCLQKVYKQDVPAGYLIDVYLTDDGCTDGTPEAIRTQYPQVHIVKGDGNLFWNRGMYIAWETAAKTKDYDFYLWLNDDTNLIEDALNILVNSANNTEDKAIIVGTTTSKTQGITTYGGYCKNKLLSPNGKLQLCDTFNGNCILIPKHVYRSIGNLDWKFRHAIGDMDYGYRAKHAGLKSYLTPTYIGYCENNPKLPAWTRPEIPLRKRIKNLYSPLGYAEPLPFFHFEKRNFGLLTAVKHFITIHIRVLFPQLWKN